MNQRTRTSPVLSFLLSTAATLGCGPTRVEAADPSFVPLFDGKTLDGWVTRGGHYDGDAEWTVEDGCITGRQSADGKGGLIYTAKPYTEFVLELDARIDEPFDSGIFLRMAPNGRGAQVTLDVCENGEVGAIYSDGFLMHNPHGREKWKRGEWNHLEVRCTGADMRIAVVLNDEALVDYQLPAQSAGFAPTGLIGLQVHGDRTDPPRNACRFRNVRIRELSSTSSEMFTTDADGFRTPTAWGVANGWRALFDGKSLDGWEEADGAGGYSAHDGTLALLVKGSSGYLRTKEDFQDFALHLDFKMSEMTNSGVFLHGDRAGGDPAWTGCEVQVLDDFHWEERTKSQLKPWQFCGSLYGSVPPKEKALGPIGSWNSYDIEFRGPRISTRLNGKLLYDVDVSTVPVPEGRLPFAQRSKKGFIGLQRHAPDGLPGEAYCWYRNVFVRSL